MMNMISHKPRRQGLWILLALIAFSLVCAHFTSRVKGQVGVPTKKKQPEQKPIPKQQLPEQKPTPAQPSLPSGLSGIFAASREEQVQALDKLGPQFPPSFDTGKFMILAFVKGNWPVQIEYQLEAKSAAVVTVVAITSRGLKSFEGHLPGTGERRMEKFQLPDNFGDQPEPGLITIESLSDLRDQKDHVDFHLYGIGLGVEAGRFKAAGFHRSQPEMLARQLILVSDSFQSRTSSNAWSLLQSDVIDLDFTPASIDAGQGDKVTYTFRPLNKFGRWAADFRSVTREPDAEGRVIPKTKWVRTDRFDEEIGPPDSVRKEWDGKDSKGQISHGEHRLMVRAWWSALKGGASATRIADQSIIVE
jgi:hypothetical protein